MCVDQALSGREGEKERPKGGGGEVKLPYLFTSIVTSAFPWRVVRNLGTRERKRRSKQWKSFDRQET